MCDAPSIFMDKNQNKVYLFNYCKSSIPPNNEEIFYAYSIEKVEEKERNIRLYLSGFEINNLAEKQEQEIPDESFKSLVFEFHEVGNAVGLYQLNLIEGKFPTDYIGSRLNEYFTFVPNKFKTEDCGDFEG